MEEKLITRRKAFATAGALGVAAALGGVRSVHADSGSEGNSLLGTWVATVTSVRNARTFTSIVGFAAGGSLTTTDSQGPGNVAIGAWEAQSEEGFKAVFEQFAFDPTGKPLGDALVHIRGTVQGDRIHGTFTVDFELIGAQVQHNVDHGTFTGRRLKP